MTHSKAKIFNTHIRREPGGLWIWHILDETDGQLNVAASSVGAFKTEEEARTDSAQALRALRAQSLRSSP